MLKFYTIDITRERPMFQLLQIEEIDLVYGYTWFCCVWNFIFLYRILNTLKPENFKRVGEICQSETLTYILKHIGWSIYFEDVTWKWNCDLQCHKI